MIWGVKVDIFGLDSALEQPLGIGAVIPEWTGVALLISRSERMKEFSDSQVSSLVTGCIADDDGCRLARDCAETSLYHGSPCNILSLPKCFVGSE